MTIRFYLIPMETGTDPINYREVKYFKTKFGSGTIQANASIMDYGLMNVALVVADVAPEQHTELSGHADVTTVPENIDATISAGALPQVQEALESLKIPAGWVTTSHTYREILRMVASLFQFAQRHHGMHDEELITSPAQLDLTWTDIPQARRQRIRETADSLGYDYSEVQNDWRVRRILKHLGDQWADKPFYAGGFTF